MITRALAALTAMVILVAGCSVDETMQSGPGERQPEEVGSSGDTDRSAALDPVADASPTVADGDEIPSEPGDDRVEAGDPSPPASETLTAANASLDAPPPLPPLEPAAQGDVGPAVEVLQERLASFGFGPGSSDGDYGPRTATAVAAFQSLVGLDPTGEADPVTVRALTEYRYDGLLLRSGAEGPLVEELQRQLAGGPFDPGPADGQYGRKTIEAVWALEKLAGIPVDGEWGPLDAAAWEKLSDGEIGRPVEQHDVRWVEFDLSQQLVKVYDPGATVPTLVSHASSGSGIPWATEDHSGSSITPIGDFEINRRIAGWRESSLGIGRLYNPLYFYGGIAFHGSLSVPLYPASHGCVRVPMHIAEYLPDELPNGTPVHVME